MISINKGVEKLSFFHVPKTGGLLIKSILQKKGINHFFVGSQHCTPSQIKEDKRAESVCIHRLPSDWIASYWAWKTQYSSGKTEREIWQPCEPHLLWHPTWGLDKLGSNSYSQFLHNVFENYPDFYMDLWRWYDCDIIFRFEDLGRAVKFITGHDLPSVKINSSKKPERFHKDMPKEVEKWLQIADYKYRTNEKFNLW
jgi:hypothetical protein